MIHRIKRTKPQLTLRINGVATTDLRMVYRQGIHEVCCQSSEIAHSNNRCEAGDAPQMFDDCRVMECERLTK